MTELENIGDVAANIAFIQEHDIEISSNVPDIAIYTSKENDLSFEFVEDISGGNIILNEPSTICIEITTFDDIDITMIAAGTVVGYGANEMTTMKDLALSGNLYMIPGTDQYISFASGTRITNNQIGIPNSEVDFLIGAFDQGNGNVKIGKPDAGLVSIIHDFAVNGTGTYIGPSYFQDDIGTSVFVSGFAGSGWKLDKNIDYTLTVDNLYVRKAMNVYELIINQIRSTNGSLWVSDAVKIDRIQGNRCYIDTDSGSLVQPFAVDDIIRCQKWNGRGVKYYSAKVTAIASDGSYFDITVINGSDAPEAGDEVVRIGNETNTNRQGSLYLTSSDNLAPYMDILNGVTSYSFTGKTMVRLGRLEGITDSAFGGELSGYGLYSQNAYLKGFIRISGGSGYGNLTDKPTSLAGINSTEGAKLSGIASGATVGATWGVNLSSIPSTLTAPSGSGLFLSSTNMGFYSANAWKTYIDNAGNFLFGNYAGGGAGISWNQSTAVLNIRGVINITSGTGFANFTDIPSILKTPSGTGLFISSACMGYYSGGAWRTYMDNTGNFALGDIVSESGTGLYWNQSTGVLTIKGDIRATTGYLEDAEIRNGCTIGNWTISSNGLINTDDTAYIIARRSIDSTHKVEARIGANIIGSLVGGVSCPAYFENSEDNSLATNFASFFFAKNAFKNVAVAALGDVIVRGSVIQSKQYNINVTTIGSVNVAYFHSGNIIKVINTSGSVRSLFMPSIAEIRDDINGFESGTDFSVRITIFASHTNTGVVDIYPSATGTQEIRNLDGNAVTYLRIAQGESAEFIGHNVGSTVYWQIINYHT